MYKEESYSEISNSFLKSFTKDQQKNFSEKLPLFQMLQITTKVINSIKYYMFNEIEVIIFCYYLKLKNWNTNDLKEDS